MSDRQALIEAIRANPDEDTPRLALADWYEENGNCARGEFIRVQCELSRLDPGSDRYPELNVRQLQLQAEHERDWLGEWTDRLVRWEFRRGMLHEVTVCPDQYGFAKGLFRDHPIWRVAFVDENGESLSPAAIRMVLSQPHSRFLRAIDAAGCKPGEQAAAMFGGRIQTNSWLSELARATALEGLRELSLFGGTRAGRDNIDLADWQTFCRAEHLRGLRHLDFSNCYGHWSSGVWEPLVRELTAARFADALRTLRFQGCNLGSEALLHLIRSRRLVRLESFEIGDAPGDGLLSPVLAEILDPQSSPGLRELTIPFGDYLAAFMDNPGWSRIDRLEFVGNSDPRSRDGGLYRATWRAVCRSPHITPTRFLVTQYDYNPTQANFWEELCGAVWFSDLTVLTIDVGDYDCAPLFGRSLDGFPKLHSLRLSPTTELVERLAGWSGLANLVELGLNDNYVSTAPEATIKLFRSPYLTPRLTRLGASGLCRTPEAVAALAECEALIGVEHLDFAFNELSRESAAKLAASPYLRHLKRLHAWSERDESENLSWLTVADPQSFPQLRDVVVGSDSTEAMQVELRRRYGPRLRVFADC